jgi:glycosyltransferase involved in cell wall biosynthesis
MPAAWAADEPIDAVIGAARLLPDVEFVITGTRPAASALDLPANVTASGFLAPDAYLRTVRSATVVLALTTAAHTMQRAGYEALSLARPLVATDHEVLRDYFGDAAVYCDPEASSIAGAVERAIDAGPLLAQRMEELRDRRSREDVEALRALGSLLDALASDRREAGRPSPGGP